ncbi:protein translocase subunit [Orbilia oligospora]|nr:protein translocase subunit [Orbilia oligospora]KAF3233268.1 protein translocase subunit [Orbilia oligospora]KAF3265817.1 protein translocase subunit [Orbilia oligospora]KAF3286457.1 protein translocase subunit [Orbilia oligospora]
MRPFTRSIGHAQRHSGFITSSLVRQYSIPRSIHARTISTILSKYPTASERGQAAYLNQSFPLVTFRGFHASTFLRLSDASGKKEGEEKPKDGEEPGQESKEGEGEQKEEKGEKKEKEEAPPPPPHGDKSPFAVFVETLQTEFKKSKEWNESTKAIADQAQQFTESDAVRAAREAYEKSSKVAGAATSATGETLKKVGGVIGKGAQWTWETPVMKAGRDAVKATGQGVEKMTRPIRETETYKTVKGNVQEVIDDGSSSRYGGYVEREERMRQRELREAKKGPGRKHEPMVEDPDAGTNVTLHKDAAWKESWRDFRDSNKFMQSIFTLRKQYDESENPFISTTRNIADRVAGFFAENETAQVIKKFKEMDPSFQLEPFLRELREWILPEVLDAYVKGDAEILQQWLSAAQYSVYSALSNQYKTAGLRSDGRVLDIRNVDIMHAKLLDPGEIPVFIVTCRAQEVHVYRDIKSGNLAAGMEDRVQQVTYAIGLTRLVEDISNPETGGWRLIELQKSGRDYI